MTGPTDSVVVGRIGRAHGVRGDVAVDPHTDAPELRFVDGASLCTEPADRGPLVVASSRWHSGRLLVRFAGIEDRNAAEQLSGIFLVIDRASLGEAGPDAWWDHELTGLRAETPDGAPLGTVSEVIHGPAQALLCVRTADGRDVLVPFVQALVPVVEPEAGRVVIDPPAGLFEA